VRYDEAVTAYDKPQNIHDGSDCKLQICGAEWKFDRISVNTEKTKYMLLSRHQNAGQNHDIKIANRCFENVEQFRYLGTTITNQNLIQEEIELG
jgi:hypothetical protein